MSAELSDDRRALLRVFVLEAAERLDVLEGLLLEIEEAPTGAELLRQFMAAAHTLKGSAGVTGLEATSELAHTIETVLQSLRDGHLPATPEMFDLVSRALTQITDSLGEIAASGEEPRATNEIGQTIEGWLAQAAARPAKTPAAPKSEIALGEYDQVRIKVLREQGKALFLLRVPVQLGGTEPSAWFNGLARSLREFGVVIATQPKVSEPDALESAGEITVLMGSSHDAKDLAEQITSAIGVTARIEAFAGDQPSQPPGEDQQALAPWVEERTVRVDLQELDDLLRLVGELMISRDRFHLVARGLSEELAATELAAETIESASQLGQLTSELQDAIMRARMVPVARALRTVKRSVRRVAREAGVTIPLTTVGEQTELDKNLVDNLTDPLAEFCGELTRAQLRDDDASPAGLRIEADRRWNRVVLQVTTPPYATATPESLAALHDAIEAVDGQLEERTLGSGEICYAISLPLTLAIIKVMMSSVGDEIYAFPIEAVRETLSLKTETLAFIKGCRVVDLRGEALSLIFLREFFDVPDVAGPRDGHVLVLSDGENRVGVTVDHLLGIREVVIKPLSSRFAHLRTLSGSAILGDEQIALILNADALVRDAIEKARRAGSRRGERPEMRTTA